MDYSPAWSPDGGFIAFLREVSHDKTDIVLVPQRGGPERILSEIKGSMQHALPWGPVLVLDSGLEVDRLPMRSGERVWALHLFSTQTGEQIELTNPPNSEIGDVAPAVPLSVVVVGGVEMWVKRGVTLTFHLEQKIGQVEVAHYRSGQSQRPCRHGSSRSAWRATGSSSTRSSANIAITRPCIGRA